MTEEIGWQKDDEVETIKEQQSTFLMVEEKFELKPVLKFNHWFSPLQGVSWGKGTVSIIQRHAYIHFISVLSIENYFSVLGFSEIPHCLGV